MKKFLLIALGLLFVTTALGCTTDTDDDSADDDSAA